MINPNKIIKITQLREALVDEILEPENPVSQEVQMPLLSPSSVQKRNIFFKKQRRNVPETEVRKQCTHCYQSKTASVGSVRATKDFEKVSTSCATCDTYMY